MRVKTVGIAAAIVLGGYWAGTEGAAAKSGLLSLGAAAAKAVHAYEGGEKDYSSGTVMTPSVLKECVKFDNELEPKKKTANATVSRFNLWADALSAWVEVLNAEIEAADPENDPGAEAREAEIAQFREQREAQMARKIVIDRMRDEIQEQVEAFNADCAKEYYMDDYETVAAELGYGWSGD